LFIPVLRMKSDAFFGSNVKLIKFQRPVGHAWRARSTEMSRRRKISVRRSITRMELGQWL